MSFQAIESSVHQIYHFFTILSHSSYFKYYKSVSDIVHENKPCSQVKTKTLLLLEAGKYFVIDPFIIKKITDPQHEKGELIREALVEIVSSPCGWAVCEQ